jgi:integrase
MAWITEHKSKSSGVKSYYVRWRDTSMNGKVQTETFSKHDGRTNLSNAEWFKGMVDGSEQRWPKGWIKGDGFPKEPDPQPEPEPTVHTLVSVGTEFYDNKTNITPETRDRNKGNLARLAALPLEKDGRPYNPFAGPIQDITEDDIEFWKKEWPRLVRGQGKRRAPKTLSNYHGTLFSVFKYAVRKKIIFVNPCENTAISQKYIKQTRPRKVILDRVAFRRILDLAPEELRRFIFVAAMTGMRYGELTALMVQDINFDTNEIVVEKAWKRSGENGDTDVPQFIEDILKPKHYMRGHYLGVTKSLHSRRTLHMPKPLAEVMNLLVDGKEPDDFIFTSPTGLPLHHVDFYERLTTPFMRELEKAGLPRFTLHGLRHTHATWMISDGVTVPDVSRRLGHSSIDTTIENYWQESQASKNAVDRAMDNIMELLQDGEDVVAVPDVVEEIPEEDDDDF